MISLIYLDKSNGRLPFLSACSSFRYNLELKAFYFLSSFSIVIQKKTQTSKLLDTRYYNHSLSHNIEFLCTGSQLSYKKKEI